MKKIIILLLSSFILFSCSAKEELPENMTNNTVNIEQNIVNENTSLEYEEPVAITNAWCLETEIDWFNIQKLAHLQASTNTKTWSTVIENWSEQITTTYTCNNGELKNVLSKTEIVCDKEYHNDEKTCVSNTNTQSCLETWTIPENSKYDIQDVTATWNISTESWDIEECSWLCDPDYVKEEDVCTKILNIENSLRFNSKKNAYLTRVSNANWNEKTWTWSLWVKRWDIDKQGILFWWGELDNLEFLSFNKDNSLSFNINNWRTRIQTSEKYTDTSIWYHIVAIYDSTQKKPGDRLRLYVNWEKPKVNWEASVVLDELSTLNNTENMILATKPDFLNYFDGYMANIDFVDWEALTPENFAMDNDWEWLAKEYIGDYGINWFKLEFLDSNKIWKDTSGNLNNWEASVIGEAKIISSVWWAMHSTDQSKVWASSIYFDWQDDYIEISDSPDWDFVDTEAYTIDMWVYPLSTDGIKTLFSQSNWYEKEGFVYYSSRLEDSLRFKVQDLSPLESAHEIKLYWLSAKNSLEVNKWTHIALSRDSSGNWYMFENWKLVATQSNNWELISWGDSSLFIGRDVLYSGKNFHGYIDEIRFSKQIARFTSNFTPEETSLLSDPNTKLLIHSDTVSWSTTFKDSAPLRVPDMDDIITEEKTEK